MRFLESCRTIASLVTLSLLLIDAGATADAQDFPSRPVRLVVGYAPGGGTDTLARIVAQKLSVRLGQQVYVENRAGAGGTLASEVVASASPDGYTYYFAETGVLVAPFVHAKVNYDPMRSFTPVAPIGTVHLALVANREVAADTPAQLIKLLKERPRQYFYATPGVGTVQHLAGELLKKLASVEMEHVPFRGAAPAITGIISGHVQLGFVSLPPALVQSQSGHLKLIGITSRDRPKIAPETQVLAEILPGFEASPSMFILGPAKIPAEIASRMLQEVAATLKEIDVQKAFENQGATVAEVLTVQALKAMK